MKRVSSFIVLASLFLLAGCQGKQTPISFELQFDTENEQEQAELALASMRVAERRLENIGEPLVDKSIVEKGDKTFLNITVEDPVGAEILTDQMTETFSLAFMAQVPEEQADIVITGHGGFKRSGINEDVLEGIKAELDPAGKGMITLEFTEEGRQKMGDLFAVNVDKYIGMFVRDQLVSKLLVEGAELKENIIIRDLPSPEIAEIFADDVNVGLHVTFIPVEHD